MVMVNSTMLPLGTEAPPFRLPDTGLPETEGRTVSLEDFPDAPGLLVIFLCNHCPFVIHIREGIARCVKGYQAKGLAVVGISANDVENHPDDSPEKMKEEVESVGYTFPYLYDETQEVARVYRAACTPDFFLFDRNRKLTYRGQFDGSRPGNDEPVTGADLSAAVDALLAGQPAPEPQTPSAGCNIKWKAGKEPEYFQP
ncbi:MAG: thioredoxin family protein [Planctomycetota bacterium]|nr:thioredoxin family protein [Planctomycetota bacterium]